MQIQKKHRYHGAALAQIVEHEHFSALNKASLAYGHYRLNGSTIFFVKYTGVSSSPWKFTFNSDELARLDTEAENAPFFALVCGFTSVCLLDDEQLWHVLHRGNPGDQQHLVVELPPGGSMRVSGPGGRLQETIRHSRFLYALFGTR